MELVLWSQSLKSLTAMISTFVVAEVLAHQPGPIDPNSRRTQTN